MRLVWLLLFAIGAPIHVLAQGAEALQVTFVVNDAFVKDRFLEGVAVTVESQTDEGAVFAGVTDADGTLAVSLPAATYRVSYARQGYVPIGRSETSVHTDGQVITTALSMLLEAEASGSAHRVRIILNWGSDEAQVRDADSHLLCACGQGNAHVYYVEKNHAIDGHSADLDVDDTDWGGPETITINDPPPGEYLYWVHDYSGPPAVIGESDVVVRVLFDDMVGGEFRAPRDVASRSWRPFKALVIEQDLRPRIVRFSDQELGGLLDRAAPHEAGVLDDYDEIGSGCVGVVVTAFLGLLVVVVVIVALIARRRRR